MQPLIASFNHVAYDDAMKTTPKPRPSSIEKLVEFNDGAIALAAKVNERFPNSPLLRQQVERWLARKWASPYRFPQLMPFAPPEMTEADLHADRDRVLRPAPSPKRLPAKAPAGPAAATPSRRAYDALPPEPMRPVLPPEESPFDRRHAVVADRRHAVVSERRRR